MKHFKRSVAPKEATIAMSLLKLAAGAIADRYEVMQSITDDAGDIAGSHFLGPRDLLELPVIDGQTALHVCARFGRAETLGRLLGLPNADINAKDGDGRTALHLASRFGHNRCVELLLGATSDVDASDIFGCTALHLAIKYRHVDVAQVLVNRSATSISSADCNLRTPLHEAALIGSAELCNILVWKGANAGVKDVFGRTPLMLACCAGYLDAASCLLQAHIAISCSSDGDNWTSAEDNEGATALHYAVALNHLQVVELLLKNMCDVNKAQICGSAALHIAVAKGYREITEALLSHGALIDAVDEQGATPLHKATANNRVDCVNLLLAKSATAGIRDNEGRTAIHVAAAAGHTAVLKAILKHGGSKLLTTADHCLRTPLHYAAACTLCHTACVEALLAFASGQNQDTILSLIQMQDIQGRVAAHCAATRPEGSATLGVLLQHGSGLLALGDAEMKTSLHLAAENNCCENIKLMLRHHADINATDLEGHTALHRACAMGHEQAVALLLASDADISLRDCKGKQALLVASEMAHAGVVQLLLSSGSEVNALDGLKCTALHYACFADASEVVQLLIDAGADLKARDASGCTPLQTSIAAGSGWAATAIVTHDKWETSLRAVDSDGFTPMKSLIERMPNVAKIVMDKCVIRRCAVHASGKRIDETVYNYSYIDPHPDDPCCSKTKQWFVRTMAAAKHQDLLFHPLAQSNIQYKWSRFGKVTCWFRFGTFIAFLSMLTAYTIVSPAVNAAQYLDVNGCIIANTTNMTKIMQYKQYGQDSSTYQVSSGDSIVIVLQTALLAISVFYIVQEILMIAILQQGYAFRASSYTTLIMIGATIGFTCPPGYYPCLHQWRCGWIANLVTWANLVLVLASFDFIGIYVIMFTTVTKSLMKVMVLLMVFFLGFAIVFYVLQNDQTQYEKVHTSLLSVFDMAMGEINFSSNFLASTNNFSIDSLYAVSFFMFLINIVLINLTIGVTIGDIETMKVSARLQMATQKVEELHQHEAIFPHGLRRRLYMKEQIHKAPEVSRSKTLLNMVLERVSAALSPPHEEEKPQQCGHSDLATEMRDLRAQMASMTKILEDLKGVASREQS